MRRAVQVLVVAVILLFCGGMFTIAIVNVREAAARAQCTNNLRILAMASENYHDTNRQFPPAAEANPDLPPEKRLSWIVAVIPFVEASNLYSKMDHKKDWDAEENRFAAQLRIKFLLCPGHSEHLSADAPTPTCYVGITGIGSDAINLPFGDGRSGFFGYERTLKLEDLKNRAGPTLMLAETSQVHGAWTAAGSPTTRGLIPDGSPYIGAGGQFGGNHRRGVNVAFADGSVRFVEQPIDPSKWEAMVTLSGRGNRE